MLKPEVVGYFHQPTGSLTYVVRAPGERECVVIDPVLDLLPTSMRFDRSHADAIIADVRDRGLTPVWILETHPHADHVSAAPYFKQELGGRIVIGANVMQVQETWSNLLNLGDKDRFDTSGFDRLLQEGDVLEAGSLRIEALSTPGHTPACLTYLIGDAAFIGDTLFMPDYGTARADFPGGSAAQLYRSIKRILALPSDTRLFLCHDYLTDTRKEHRWETTVAEQRATNVHLQDGVSEAEFVNFREGRDKNLSCPALLLSAVQLNLRAGNLPPEEENGIRYLKLPLNRF